MKFQQLLIFILFLIFVPVTLFFILSADFLRVDVISPVSGTSKDESIAQIFYNNSKEYTAYPQTWIDIICRRTGYVCGEKTDFDLSRGAVKQYLTFRQQESFEPWFLDSVVSTEELNGSYIYVAQEGNDEASGELTDPLRSIQKAVDIATPGTNIIVESGDYSDTDFITISKKASKQKPIRLLASGGEVYAPQILITNSQYIEISGFTIVGPEQIPENWVDMPAVFVDNPAIQIDISQGYEAGRKSKIEKKYKTWLELLNWEKSQGTSAGISVVNSQYITLTKNTISYATYGIQLANDSRRILISDNHLHHNLVGITGTIFGENNYSFSESLIKNNLVEQSFRTGIAVHYGAHHNIIDSNEVKYSGTSQVNTYRAAGNNLFIFNTIEHGGFYTETMEYPGSSALSLHSCKKGCIAFGNYLAYQYDKTGADGNGIIVDFTDQGAYLAANIIYRTQGSGVVSVKSGNNMIVNNTIVESGFEPIYQEKTAAIKTFSASRDAENIIANNVIHIPKNAGLLLAGNVDSQKFIGNNIFSVGEAAVLIEGTNQEAKQYFSTDDLETVEGFREPIIEPAQFVDMDDEKLQFKLSRSSQGYDSANEQLMSEFNHIGEPWSANIIGAL